MSNKPNFVFLIDGSPAMFEKPGLNERKLALNSLSAIDCAARLSESFNVASWFFGSKDGLTLDPRSNDLQNPQALQALGHVMVFGGMLAPSVRNLAEVIQNAAAMTHVVIVSTGNILDANEAKNALYDLVEKNSMVTLDAVVVGQKNSALERAVSDLRNPWMKNPGRVGAVNVVSLDKVSNNIFIDAVSARLEVPVPTPPKPFNPGINLE